MMRKQASQLPEAAETVDTMQPAGGHSADQHKNNSTTVVKNPPMEERGGDVSGTGSPAAVLQQRERS